MVKLTKSQFETKITKMVENNDYENLETLISENPNYDINFINRRNASLLYLAISSKSKECFDYILSHPKFILHTKIPKINKTLLNLDYDCYIPDIDYDGSSNNDYGDWGESDNSDDQEAEPNDHEDSSDSNNSDDEYYHMDEEVTADTKFSVLQYNHYVGIDASITRFINAPNLPNSHYIRELIKKKVYLSPKNLLLLENFSELFNKIFSNMQNNHIYMNNLLLLLIENKSTNINNVYNIIKNNMTQTDTNNCIKKSIKYNNIDMLKLLINDGHDIRMIDISGANKPEYKYIDCLTYSIYMLTNTNKCFNNFMVTYIKENSLFSHELNNKFNPKLFVKVMLSKDNCHNDIIKEMDTIKQLEIEEDISPMIMTQFTKFLLYGSLESIQLESLNLLLGLKFCKSNIFEHMEVDRIFKYIESEARYYNLEVIINKVVGLLYLGKYHNMEPTEEIKTKLYKILKIKNLDDYQTYYKDNIKHDPLQQKTQKKTPVKKTKTKKPTDIDV